METSSVSSEKRKHLIEELNGLGIVLNATGAKQVTDEMLQGLLSVAEKEKRASDKWEDQLAQRYESMMVDYIFKLTLATVLLFASNPWAALFWPPYYYRRGNE